MKYRTCLTVSLSRRPLLDRVRLQGARLAMLRSCPLYGLFFWLALVNAVDISF